jgi:hypothetical protein
MVVRWENPGIVGKIMVPYIKNLYKTRPVRAFECSIYYKFGKMG